MFGPLTCWKTLKSAPVPDVWSDALIFKARLYGAGSEACLLAFHRRRAESSDLPFDLARLIDGVAPNQKKDEK